MSGPSRMGTFAPEAVIRGDSVLNLLELDLDNLEGLATETFRQWLNASICCTDPAFAWMSSVRPSG
jgi:hypothetical protein